MLIVWCALVDTYLLRLRPGIVRRVRAIRIFRCPVCSRLCHTTGMMISCRALGEGAGNCGEARSGGWNSVLPCALSYHRQGLGPSSPAFTCTPTVCLQPGPAWTPPDLCLPPPLAVPLRSATAPLPRQEPREKALFSPYMKHVPSVMPSETDTLSIVFVEVLGPPPAPPDRQ